MNDATNDDDDDDDTQETEKHFMTISATAADEQGAGTGRGEKGGTREEGEFRSIHRSIIFAVFRSCYTGNGHGPTGRERTDGRTEAGGLLACRLALSPPFVVVLRASRGCFCSPGYRVARRTVTRQ